jgi:nitronate monooxygenase
MPAADRIRDLSRWPIVVSPMAGGPTGPALVIAAARAGALPFLAAGNGAIAGPDEVATVLAAGAVAAQAGTAFLRCAERGANPAYRRALADPRFTSTAITGAFSGRRARGLVNRFTREHQGPPKAYPEINNATRPLRAAAAASGDPDRMSLYAGVNFRRAEARPAGEIITQLAAGVGGGPEV